MDRIVRPPRALLLAHHGAWITCARLAGFDPGDAGDEGTEEGGDGGGLAGALPAQAGQAQHGGERSGEEAAETHGDAGRAVAQRFRGDGRLRFETKADPGLERGGGQTEGVEGSVVVVTEKPQDRDG